MHPAILFILAILTPILLVTTLLVPLYAGIASASYIIHKADKMLVNQLDNVFYIIDVYNHDFVFWTHHMADASVIHYTLPVLGLPLLGLFLSYWLTRKLAVKLKTFFQMGTGF
ncbi:MAG: hypothetical protein ACOYNL_05415 [Rickettsiales bacterium]